MVYIHVLTIVELIWPMLQTYQKLQWAMFMYLFVLLLFSISVCLFIYIIWLTGTKDFIITKKWNCTRCFGLGLLQTQRRLKHHVQFHFFVIINIFGVTLIRSTKYKYLLNQQPKDSLSNAINDNFSFKILVHCVSRHIKELTESFSIFLLKEKKLSNGDLYWSTRVPHLCSVKNVFSVYYLTFLVCLVAFSQVTVH